MATCEACDKDFELRRPAFLVEGPSQSGAPFSLCPDCLSIQGKVVGDDRHQHLYPAQVEKEPQDAKREQEKQKQEEITKKAYDGTNLHELIEINRQQLWLLRYIAAMVALIWFLGFSSCSKM